MSPQSAMIAPSIILRDIWSNDRDFRGFYESIFANLHDSFKLSKPVMNDDKAGIEHIDVTTDIPEDLKMFYLNNQIQFKHFSQI